MLAILFRPILGYGLRSGLASKKRNLMCNEKAWASSEGTGDSLFHKISVYNRFCLQLCYCRAICTFLLPNDFPPDDTFVYSAFELSHLEPNNSTFQPTNSRIIVKIAIFKITECQLIVCFKSPLV